MGWVNLLMSTVAKCLEVMGVLLDLNFFIVHAVVRTVVGVLSFVYNLPTLLANLAVDLAGLGTLCTSSLAHGASCMMGSTGLALEGLFESMKMVGYLAMHYLLRGKHHLCRALLWLPQACSIILSLLVYLVNTVVNFALIATQNVYAALVAVLHTLASPLHKLLDVTLTSLAFLYRGLVWTCAFLWSPCKLALDFTFSLVQMFISIFILNIYGLLLTVLIAFTTTAYLNPELARQAGGRLLGLINSSPILRRFHRALRRLSAAARGSPRLLRAAVRHLSRMCLHLHALERGLWQQASGLGSQLTLALRTQLHRSGRVGGDGEPGNERRDPPDGRAAGGEARPERVDSQVPSSSTSRPLGKLPSSGKDGKSDPENLLTLLKEQEERKKCVICQDCNKTVVLLPCRHLCLCRECKNILLMQPIYQQNCPLCRHMILNTMDVYL